MILTADTRLFEDIYTDFDKVVIYSFYPENDRCCLKLFIDSRCRHPLRFLLVQVVTVVTGIVQVS